MQENQRVAHMAIEVLARQAGARAEWTGEPFEEALKAVLETEAGHQLTGLRDGPHRNEEAERWQDELAPKRAKKRKQARQEERRLVSLAQRDAACEQFMQAALRKEGQLAGRPSWETSDDRKVRVNDPDHRDHQKSAIRYPRSSLR